MQRNAEVSGHIYASEKNPSAERYSRQERGLMRRIRGFARIEFERNLVAAQHRLCFGKSLRLAVVHGAFGKPVKLFS